MHFDKMSVPNMSLLRSQLSSKYIWLGALTVFIFFSLLTISSDNSKALPSTLNPQKWHSSTPSHPPNPQPANSTLDFQAILYISMPHRTDRQDAMSLIAAQTGLKLTLIDGVPTSQVHEKARPFASAYPENDREKPGVGIWRAHANAWRYVIDNGLGSALILEDDVDWDVNVRRIMGLWNWQMRWNNSMRVDGEEGERKEQDCAYGCDWHELFMGQCNNNPHPGDLRHHAYHDPYAPPLSTLHPIYSKEMTQIWNFSTTDSQVRVVAPTWHPLCLQGYALTQTGARRALYQIGGFSTMSEPVDVEFIRHTQSGQLKGYTLNPPVFTKWQLEDGVRDSDNDYKTGWGEKSVKTSENKRSARMRRRGEADEGMGEGKSWGLVESARESLRSLGEVVVEWDVEAEAQWGESR